MTATEALSADSPGVYGQRLGDCFGLSREPEYIRIDTSAIAVTQIRCDWPNNGLTAPLPVEDAFLITLNLAPCAHHDLWIDGQPRQTGPLSRGDVSIYDLRTSPVVNSTTPFRNLHFYVPRATLDSISAQEEIMPVDEMPNEPGMGLADPVLSGLGLSLESTFARPGQTTRIFVEHVTSAMVAHLVRRFGAHRYRSPPALVRLSHRQERVAKELLSASLDGDLTTADIAEACGLSVGSFRGGFRQATGAMPHQWLTMRRLDRARDLLSRPQLPADEIARLAGFADARHMRRVFKVVTGRVPRRLHGGDA